jgi:hypothetical protein
VETATVYRRVAGNCGAAGSRGVVLIDVPEGYCGVGPAVVLDPIDRVTYQEDEDNSSCDAECRQFAQPMGASACGLIGR